MARKKEYYGVICGHIHQAALQDYDGVMYMNSGDWVETLSALVEDEKGNWEIVYYTDFVKEESKI